MTTQMSDDVVATVRRRITRVGRELEGVRGAIPEITDGIADGAGEFAWLLTPATRTYSASWRAALQVLGNATDVVVTTTKQQRDDLTTIDDRRGS